jgi:protein-disulfide reductase (glutathione)
VTLVPRTAALALAFTSSLVLLACNGDPAGANAGSPAATAATPAATTAATPRKATAPDHGYGDKIAWRGLDEGFKEAAETGRPLMMVVHAAWCPRCRELKQRFFEPALAETSERFIMVNLDQDQTPEALRHGPDGQYIPRILFFDPQGRLDPALSNPSRSKYKYFYTMHDDLVGMMQQVLERYPAHAS